MTSYRKYFLIFTILVFALSYADRIKWSTELEGDISGGLILHGNYLYVSGRNALYKVDTLTGKELWKTTVKGTLLKPVWKGTELLVPSREGTIYTVSDISRKVVREVNISGLILGDSVLSGNMLYIPTSKGIVALDTTNNRVKWTAGNCRTGASPLILTNKLIMLCNEGIVKEVSLDSGEVLSSTKYGGGFWNVPPVKIGTKVIIPGFDGKIYFASTSSTKVVVGKYTYDGNPLSTEPVALDGSSFLGITNTGYACKYKLNGDYEWCIKLDSESTSKPIVTTNNIYVVTDRGTIYGISKDGEIKWQVETELSLKHDFAKKVSLMYGVSRNGKIIAVSTSSCTITSPPDGYDVAGLDYIDTNVDAYSDSEIRNVLVRINGGNWIETQVNKEGLYTVEIPGNRFRVGDNKIECKVSSTSGDEQAPYTSVSVIKSPNPRKMSVDVPTSVAYGSAFTITVRDRDTGEILDGVDIEFGDLVYKNVNGKYSLTPPKKGSYTLIVKKGGYNQFKTTINVGENYTIPIILGVIALVLLGMAYMVYRKWMEE